MKPMQRFYGWLPVLALLAAAVPAAYAQDGRISGRVTDPTGAVITGADITILHTETGARRKLATNVEGYYNAPALQPGQYQLVAQKEGFKSATNDRIVVQVGDNLTVNVQMELGSVNETVAVVAEAPLLRVEDAETGQVIDRKRIAELPQYNRNALAFATLAAGVSGTSEQAGRNYDFRIAGGRTSQTEYMVDGIPVTTGYTHDVPSSVPSPEAVEEFKVVTNGMSAEYGRLSGGAVIMATRGGTNEYHGSAYEFLRNDLMNANGWNDNRYGQPKGAFHDNVFGGSLGGPVRIPKLYNGRDRTFFFLNYEGLRHSEGSNATLASVPTELERQGDFSQSLVDQGSPVQIFDPTAAQLVNGQVVRQPFAGNKVPQSRIDPIAKIYSDYYPLPNQPALAGSSHDNNYVGSSTNQRGNNRWTGRLDQYWSASQTTHFSMTNYDDHRDEPRWLSALQQSSTNYSTSKTAAVSHVSVLNPQTVLQLRLGMVRTTSFEGLEVGVDSSGWGLQNEVYRLMGSGKGRAPYVSTSGDTLTGLGGGSGTAVFETNYNVSATLSRTMGRHHLKAGYEHRRYYTNYYQGGDFSYSSSRDTTRMNPLVSDHTGAYYAGFLLGNVIWGGGNQYAGPASLQSYHAAFFQDDMKLTSRLTVNAGVRWDFEPPRTERYDRQIFWDKDYTWNWKQNPGWTWENALQQASVTGSVAAPVWMTQGIHGRVARMGTQEYPGRTLAETYPAHFSPHLGLAYQLANRTVLRASYGMNWLTTTGSWFLGSARWNLGYGDSALLMQGGSFDGQLTYPLTLRTPMPGGAGYVPVTTDIGQMNQTAMGTWFLAQSPQTYPGYEHAMSLGIQRQFGSGDNSWVVELNGLARLGRDLPFWLGRGEHILPDAYNKIGPLGSKLAALVDNPFYGQIPSTGWISGEKTQLGRVLQVMPLWAEVWTMGEPAGTSNYYAGYVQVEHRFGKGFSLLANYTISKMLQDVGGNDQGGSFDGNAAYDINGYPQAGLGLKDVYGVAPTDMTHRLVMNYSLELPFGRGKRLLGNPQGTAATILDKIAGGWTLAGTGIYRSGTPLSVFAGSGFWSGVGQGRNSTRARFVDRNFDNGVDGHTALIGAAGSTPYLNPGSFRLLEQAEIGDTPATMSYFRGPGSSQWDLSLLKNIPLFGESKYMQLRLEAQNAFNHMNTANPDTNPTSSTFGYITSQSGLSRRVMIAAKIVF
jgi:hypothetical protein